ncbi:F-box protein Hrt3p [Monosporozyma unispora]|nr:high level expression reduces ty3 transposition [Kazachstania unispora]
MNDADIIRAEVNEPHINEAISIWEKGVLKEKDGSMSDAINYYRKAIKIHDGVEKVYRKKLHDEWILHKKLQALNLDQNSESNSIKGENEDEEAILEKELLPCWILAMLPNDILLRIVKHVVLTSGESWVNLSLSCQKFNELCFHNTFPYKVFKDYIYPKQRYDEQSMTLNGVDNLKVLEKELWGEDYISMIKTRPFIKFQGVYISVVNYLRYGTNAEGSSSLLNPVHMITYYRYFRFYEDGTVLRLLATDEPAHIVKHFDKDKKPKNSEICRWGLGFDDNFGKLTVTRSNSKYIFRETLTIKKQGNKIHQRLKWVSSNVENNEGEISECSLRNEKPFYFSRVKSFKPVL